MSAAEHEMDQGAVRSYYHATLVVLHHLEARNPKGRRFGREADARWSTFKGELLTADRIDLLIRDANVEWRGAFAARTAFDLRTIAEEDPFGPSWPGLDTVAAEDLWRECQAATAPATADGALLAAARAWGISLTMVRPPEIDPADTLLVVGPSAVLALVRVFNAASSLEWESQVNAIATQPSHRHLAALAGAICGSMSTTFVDPSATARARGWKLFTSDDADPRDLAAARALAGG